MRHRRTNQTIPLAALALGATVLACSNGDAGSGGPNDPTVTTTAPGPTPGPTLGSTPTPGASDPSTTSNPNIELRTVDYSEAYRTASLKLVDELPSFSEMEAIATAMDPKAVYERLIDRLLADPRFAIKQIKWWKDTFKTGNAGAPADGAPNFDAAATFAAEVVVEDRPYSDIFTASKGTCPTYQGGKFVPADCPGAQPTAGILTDPGLMSQYFANMAFRRARFVQETFACSKFPAELVAQPKVVGSAADGAIYTSPWPLDSIAGGKDARVDFQSTSTKNICANCHTTLNHIAPLFAYFDANGKYTPGQIDTVTPSVGNPTSVLADWLPAGKQTFAWRDGKPVTDLPSLGKTIAADPDVAACVVDRIWNFAMSRGDIVNDVAVVPPTVSSPLVQDFVQNGMKLRRLVRNVFTSDDYVRF